jgi:hypothetical protein
MAPKFDYKTAYPGGPMVGPPLPRELTPGVPNGSDIRAFKRGIWRGGRWQGPASNFDTAYSKAFALGKTGGNVGESGIAGFQRQMKFPATGIVDEQTANAIRSARVPTGLPNAGQPLLDQTAINLLDDYIASQSKPPPAAVDQVRAAITDYCQRSIGNEPKIHYLQERAIQAFGVPPETGFSTDCSGHSTCAYYWARKQTGVAVPDPNGNGYNGYGYTGTLVNNPKVQGPYLVGDLALFGPSLSNTTHVVTCYMPGDRLSALWCSHGSEAAPYAVTLDYRTDLLAVVRPPLTP